VVAQGDVTGLGEGDDAAAGADRRWRWPGRDDVVLVRQAAAVAAIGADAVVEPGAAPGEASRAAGGPGSAVGWIRARPEA
jgi:hypothetical protein